MRIKLDKSYQNGLLKEHYRKARYLKNAQEIEDWCKSTFEGKKLWERRLPSTIGKDENEKKLGRKLSQIKYYVLKQYEGKEIEEIKDEEDRKIVEIIRSLDKEYGMKADLKNTLEVEDWCKSTFEGKKLWERRLPSTIAGDEYEKQLGKNLSSIKHHVLKQYKGQELEKIEDEEDRKIIEIMKKLDEEYGMKIVLKNALEVEEWCKSTFEGKKVWERRLPSAIAQDKYEKQLGKKMSVIRQNVLKQYEGQEIEEIEDEEDRKIVETIRELDREYGMKADLKNALEVEEWCKSTFEGKKVWERGLPSTIAQDKYEKQLGQKLSAVRQNVLKQYKGQEIEEIEDEEDRKIVEIIRNLDKEYKISLEDKKKMKKQAEMENEAAKVLCAEYEAQLKAQEERRGENK